MTRSAATLSFLILLSAPCAAEDLYTGKYSTCMEASGGVTVAMLDCIAEEVATQDARLNAAYKTLGAGLPPSRKKQLVAVQRLWIQYRDANCKFYADPDGGTAAAVASNECVLRETAARASELESLKPMQ
jgi:uncharacterized protein YecT (DUF1311 family)